MFLEEAGDFGGTWDINPQINYTSLSDLAKARDSGIITGVIRYTPGQETRCNAAPRLFGFVRALLSSALAWCSWLLPSFTATSGSSTARGWQTLGLAQTPARNVMRLNSNLSFNLPWGAVLLTRLRKSSQRLKTILSLQRRHTHSIIVSHFQMTGLKSLRSSMAGLGDRVTRTPKRSIS
jgi:hypothetical protein